MVFEALTKAGDGGLGFSLSFVCESLRASGGRRPWVIVEGPGEQRLFVGGLPRELRQAVQDRQVFWVRASKESALPEIVQLLVESTLCEGLLLRGFENFASERESRVWMRRWQLAIEKTGTHLVWVHARASSGLGVNLRVEWSAPKQWTLRKGEGLLESTPFQTLRALRTPHLRRTYVDRPTTRIA